MGPSVLASAAWPCARPLPRRASAGAPSDGARRAPAPSTARRHDLRRATWPALSRCASIESHTPDPPPTTCAPLPAQRPTKIAATHRCSHGSHLLQDVLQALWQEGCAHPHGRPRRCRQDHHPVQAQAWRDRDNVRAAPAGPRRALPGLAAQLPSLSPACRRRPGGRRAQQRAHQNLPWLPPA